MISFNHSEQLEVEGFTQYHTGGGCMALQKSLDNGDEILITDHETQIPLKEDKLVLIGLYDEEGDGQYYEQVPFDSIPEVINALQFSEFDSPILAKFRITTDPFNVFNRFLYKS